MRSRVALLGLLTSVLFMSAAASPAAAQGGDGWNYDPMPWTSTVARDTPLYADTPDGWSCHFLGPCRPDASRLDTDPAPIAELHEGQDVEFKCEFGAYSKVNTMDGSLTGWMARADLQQPYGNRPDTCSALQWNGW